MKNSEEERLKRELRELYEEKRMFNIQLKHAEGEERERTKELIADIDSDIEAYEAHIRLYTLLVKGMGEHERRY